MLRTCRDKSPEVQNVSLSALQSESGIPGMLQYGRYRASVHILPSTPLPPPCPLFSGQLLRDMDNGQGRRCWGRGREGLRYTLACGTVHGTVRYTCTLHYGLWTMDYRPACNGLACLLRCFFVLGQCLIGTHLRGHDTLVVSCVATVCYAGSVSRETHCVRHQ